MNENIMDKYFRWQIPTDVGIKEVRRLKINDKYTWLRAVRAAVAGDLPVTADATRSLPMIEYTVRGAGPFQSGTPEPDNPVEINGAGVRTDNMFDVNKALVQNWYDGSGNRVTQSFAFTSQFLKVGSATAISFNYSVGITNSEICFFDINKTFISRVVRSNIAETIPENAEYFIVGLYAPDNFSYTPTIDDVIKSKIMLYFGKDAKSFEPYGYKTEITNTGKNLYSFGDIYNKKTSEIIGIVNNNISNSIIFKPSTQYSFSLDIELLESISVSTGIFKLEIKHTDGTIIESAWYTLNNNSRSITSTIGKTVEYVKISSYNAYVSINMTNITIEEGIGSEFEPFHSETTPIYTPSPIFSNGYVSRSEHLGKNYFNPLAEYTIGINCYRYYIHGLDPEKYYVCSTNFNSDSTTASIYYNGESSTVNGVWANKPIYTKPDSNGTLFVQTRYLHYGTDAPVIAEDVINETYWIQIEEGTVPTEFEPTDPICNNYTEWNSLIFTGDETGWVQWAVGLADVERYYYQFSDICDIDRIDQSKCSHLNYTIGDGNNPHFRFSKNGNDYNQFVIYVDKSTITSVADLKNWLKEEYSKGTPLTLVYPLASPKTTPTTLPDINLIKGINNLDSTSPIKPNFLGTYYGIDETLQSITATVDFNSNTITRSSTDFDHCIPFMRRRCNVLDDGTITAFYGETNYTEDGSNGQVMVYQPKTYYKVEVLQSDPITDSIGYHIRKAKYSVSGYALPGYKLHPAFINEDGNECDYILISAFEGCAFDVSENQYITNDAQIVNFTLSTGDKLSSIGGVKPMSGLTQQCTRPNIENIAKNRGKGWHSYNIKVVSLNQLLAFIEFGNAQNNNGSGVTSITDNTSYNCSSLTGSTVGNGSGNAASTINDINGTQTTYTTNGKVSVNYRGMENPYGNIWDFVYGMNIHGDGTQRGGIPYIADDFNWVESKNSGNYKSAGFTVTNGNGYVKAFGYGDPKYDWLMIASEVGGSTSGIVGDYTYVTANLNGYRVAPLGGRWNHGAFAGLFYWGLDHGVGNRSRLIGGRCVYFPN